LLEDAESEEDVKFALDEMIDDPSHSYHEKAVALDAKMQSFMRGLVASI